MVDATGFITTMAALSGATQTFVEHVFKLPIPDEDAWKVKGRQQNTRHALIHLLCFAVGALLAYSVKLTPLAYLGAQQDPWVNALAAGLLVSFGGAFFNDVLGVIQEFKKAQEAIRKKAEKELREDSKRTESKPSVPGKMGQMPSAA